MSNNPNVGKVFNLTGGGGGNGALKLDSLSVTKPPIKTVYKSGESFDPTGMVVTASYGYGLTSDVTGYIVTPSVLTDGVTEVTITYTEGRVTKTASTPVTVEKVLVSISVTTPPTKTVYDYLESFSPAGMVVTAAFSDGSTAPAAGYSYSDTAFSTLGNQTVSLDYTYEGVTKSASLTVAVNPIEVAVPTQKNVPTYDGTAKSPVWEGFDSVKMDLDGDTSGVNAKDNYGVTFTLNYGYVFPDGASSASVMWKINRAVIASVPTQIDVPAADGTPKNPAWSGYDPAKMTIGGDRFGTNAGDYVATFTPTDNYQWWDGSTGPKEAPWTIASILVPVPTQKNIPTYDGSKKTPEWNNFDTEHCTVQVTSMADAGEYEATFTLLAGMWEDGGTAPKNIPWKINRASIAAVPVQTNIPSCDGNPKTPSWDSNYSAVKMTVNVEAKTNAGTYSASLTPTANYQWWDGSTGAKTASWVINRASIATVPSQNGTLTYTGSEQTVSLKNYDSAQLTLGGTIKGTNAGEYSANITPIANYQWSDGTTTAKTVKWNIAKTAGSLSLSLSAVTLNRTNLSKTVNATRAGNGAISVESSNTGVATASVNSDGVITINHVNQASGTAIITVKVAAGTNHNAPANKTITVTAQFTTIYGVEWDWTSSGPTNGVRTDAAAGFGNPSPAVNNGNGSSPFDNLMPWAGMVRETRAGGVEVKEPKYWFKWTKTGKKLKLQIADGPAEGFYVDPVNMDRGDGLGELDFSYIGRYHCGSDYKSTTNVAQKVSITRSTARSGIHGLGANFFQIDFAQFWYVGMLFLVEFADWNGEKIGRGCSTSGSTANNGATDAMQYHTGTTAANRDSYGFTQYRNIEGWWDNVFDWMDGCYYNSNGLNVITNPNQFSDSANGVLVGKPGGSNGYPSDFAIPTQSGLEWALYPSERSGSTTTYVPDVWDFSGSNPCLFHGGSYYQNQSYGPFYVYYSSASNSYAYIGCRLQERPPKAA